MTLSLTISPEVEAKLRESAAARGEPVDVYASKVLADAVVARSMDELLTPVRQQVSQAGMSDWELDEFLQTLRDKAWQDKRSDPP